MEDRLQRLLHDLGRTLVQAFSDSSDAHQVVRRAHQEGYALYLVLSCQQEGEKAAKMELKARPQLPPAREPEFLLSGSDVAFLRSVGIDPTRRVRRKRSS